MYRDDRPQDHRAKFELPAELVRRRYSGFDLGLYGIHVLAARTYHSVYRLFYRSAGDRRLHRLALLKVKTMAGWSWNVAGFRETNLHHSADDLDAVST